VCPDSSERVFDDEPNPGWPTERGVHRSGRKFVNRRKKRGASDHVSG
jgi:hypothetical protein